MQVTRTVAIRNFLLNKTYSELANLYNYNMECQVNIAQDDGERIEGEFEGKRWLGWTDGITTWKSFRIPWNAKTNPIYTDSIIKFDLAAHVEAIGLSGWNWKDKLSHWIAFDFDSIVSHKKGLTHEELNLIQEAARKIPWITIRKSTSGNGIHFYIDLEIPIKTNNHNEHAALARSILGQLAAITRFDFINKVDICGGNMWIWHRKMLNTDGLKLIKQGSKISFDQIPKTWKDHIKVVTGRQIKNLPQEITNESETDRLFKELTGQNIREPLDSEHKKLIDYLREHKCMWWWDQDNNMLITHTYHLKIAHTDLVLKGIFETISEGKQLGTDHNCFAYPIRKGGWVVRRFTQGVSEHDSWEQDGAGWTRCFYNIDPSLATVARSNTGIEHPSGGYVFSEAELAEKAAKLLGANLNLPPWAMIRTTKLKKHKDGRLIVEVAQENEDNPEHMSGWLPEGKKWKRIFNVKTNTTTGLESQNYDDLLRHLVNERNEDHGWVIKTDSAWVKEPITHIKFALGSLNLSFQDITSVLGDSIFKRWTIVNKPFQSEYPGERQWNRDACQLMYYPSKSDDLHYPTWLKILNHVGKSLTDTLKTFPWAVNNGIITGTDYLKCWIASVFQFPNKHLPYLFLWGPESSGKSIFHESLSLLISPSGYQDGGIALLSQQAFNGELTNVVICYVEEINLSQKNKVAATRIRNWTTGEGMQIHAKGGTPYLAENTTHWIQCSNPATYCPIFPGDTRVTMVNVKELSDKERENKEKLTIRLKKEAPDFLGALMRLELPESPDRFNIPVIETSDKARIQKQNQTALEDFIDDNCFYAPGYMVKLSIFYENFMKWIDAEEIHNWSKQKIGKTLDMKYVKGRGRDAQFYIGNMSFEQQEDGRCELILINNQLVSRKD